MFLLNEEQVEVTCDRCGVVAPDPDGGYDDNFWAGGYELHGVTIERREGARYPHSSWQDSEFWDICPECWEKEVRPFMVSLAGDPQKGRKDW